MSVRWPCIQLHAGMGKKSDISEIIRYLKSIEESRRGMSMRALLSLLQDESVFIHIEAIDLNIVLRSTPELSKEQADKIKKHKRLLRKRIAKKGFEARTKIRNSDLERHLELLLAEKNRLLGEKLYLQNEVQTYCEGIIQATTQES